jgi:tRNA dimethylallyltransferase
MRTIICLMGPTATGKSDLALHIAEQFPVDIISVDSAMVYRGMDIGTAKPAKDILKNIPHYLINICNPDEIYSAGEFCKDAVEAVKIIEKKQHIPLLVGGTMLYFRALQKGLSVLPTQDKNIRHKIDKEAKEIGWNKMHEKLSQIDPVTSKRLHPNDAQRIQRALEVYEITGTPLSQFHSHQNSYLENYSVINIGLIPSDREKLKENIVKRFYKMLDNGFIEEVKNLISFKNTSALRSVGYRQICEYLEGQYDKETMIQKAVIATQQLAKRQLTWLRSFPDITFFESDSLTLVRDLSRFLQQKIAINQI